MFPKELGDKIVAKFPSRLWRLSILSTLKLEILKKFLVSQPAFSKPKVTSIVIHFRPKENISFKIKDVNNLEKVIIFYFLIKEKWSIKNIKILAKTR